MFGLIVVNPLQNSVNNIEYKKYNECLKMVEAPGQKVIKFFLSISVHTSVKSNLKISLYKFNCGQSNKMN
jgi:hypothetical protein